jgi:hypothetical protein
MRQAFIRGVWGSYQDYKKSKSKIEYYMRESRNKIDGDIKLVTLNPHEKTLNLMVYVFGEENYKMLVDKGFQCKLINKKPNIFEIEQNWWIHKLEILKAASNDFDEFVFMDWDCIPFHDMPVDYWDMMRKKMSIQVPLRMYKKRMAYWRKEDQRKISCAAFIYIRDKNITNELMETWKRMNANVTEEAVLSRYIDDAIGGWGGVDKYLQMAEPNLCYLHLPKYEMLPKEILDAKKKFLWHIRVRDVTAILSKITETNGFDSVVKSMFG